jgi:chromosome segregation protein
MHITRLRLVGFKSFVEPTELIIENGLTGVVGPNGCGKSNLLEALRWVMGETSYKSMRAAAMDDVIFSGTSGRPGRTMAEVTVFVDNTGRQAPAEFNDADEIEISRRIERETGSAYRINNREVRARDVKILFEDAATGARSPALVRQGQIGEIVNAKPEQRRRILEDAAGVAGLHSRRHEAELRLRAAEGNLARIGDVLGQLKAQVDGLKRQARQARRYADLSRDIRETEAVQLFLTWQAAQDEVDHNEAELGQAMDELGQATRSESEATRAEAEVAEKIQPLREAEVVRSAAVARLNNERVALDKDAEQARARCIELEGVINQIGADIDREKRLVAEAGELLTTLDKNLVTLKASDESDGARETTVQKRIAEAERGLAEQEEALTTASAALSEARAEHSALQTRIGERERQAEQLASRLRHLEQQIADVSARAPDAELHTKLAAEVAFLAGEIARIEPETRLAETQARERDTAARSALQQREAATLAVRQVETEIATLNRLLEDNGSKHDGMVERLKVRRGYERALGAALGDALDAPIGDDAPLHWRLITSRDDDPSLPNGVESLSRFVTGPPELARRLSQTGLVKSSQGDALQDELRPGQCLVSKEGALWRWDGFVAKAGAPTAAAQRLALRNRLDSLQTDRAEADDALARAAQTAEAAQAAADGKRQRAEKLREEWREAQSGYARMAQELAEVERVARETQGQLQAHDEAKSEAHRELQQAKAALAEQTAALAALDGLNALEERAGAARTATGAARDAVAEARAEFTGLKREQEHRAAQKAALEADIARWSARAEHGSAQIETLEGRYAATRRELDEIVKLPASLEERRQRLLDELKKAEDERKAAADAVVAAETAHKEAVAKLRTAQSVVTERREARARAEARLEGARTKRQSITAHIRETLDTTPEGCLALACYEDSNGVDLPALTDVEAKLGRLKVERERLGGVNLQAEAELESIESQFNEMDRERADVEAAIAKLRGGISSLNREGRKRLKEAFEEVDRHFRQLFSTLFGGGEARLEMLEDPEDPLAGGLEIIAKPPGKQPTSLSLLSGGEQSLTALSLIFAVFLTNPSPICVLDEVDAPLDDSNVERFCRLMEKMAHDTETRFLVITHHPMTMSRMDRLFGVTMVEKGVSQLVSVDLSEAETLLETG